LPTYRTGNKDIRDCETGNTVCIEKTKLQEEIWKGTFEKRTLERPRSIKEQNYDRS
jgi:hypothetical protein